MVGFLLHIVNGVVSVFQMADFLGYHQLLAMVCKYIWLQFGTHDEEALFALFEVMHDVTPNDVALIHAQFPLTKVAEPDMPSPVAPVV
jgi:predicted CoA-binding protein